MNPYRERTWALLEPLVQSLGRLEAVLDFGCGDGWFASQMMASGLADKLVPLDVKRRNNVLVEPLIYAPDEPLPFGDNSFDLIYTVDVLHHCCDPFAQLDELSRVSKQYLLIKDHTFKTVAGRVTLAVLDELGNRKFGIPSPYHYQQKWSWEEHLQKKGWVRRALIHPAACHTGVLGYLTNGLQYVALYERVSD